MTEHASEVYPVFLLGGTAESAELVRALAACAAPVLLSTATDEPLTLPDLPGAYRRIAGRLDVPALVRMLREHQVRVLVCAVHPYAAAARENARQAAQECGLPFAVYLRGATDFAAPAGDSPPNGQAASAGIHFAESHEEAAGIACGFGVPVLLTTGSRNLHPYAQAAHAAPVPLYARMLDNAEAHAAADAAGIPPERRITARGPFTVEENCAQIRRTGAGVLVSKDGGEAGGMREKIAAAEICRCRLVLVRRPAYDGQACGTLDELVALVRRAISPRRNAAAKTC